MHYVMQTRWGRGHTCRPFSQKKLVDFVLCVGDDRSDEDMFALIRDRFSSNNPNPTCAVRLRVWG